MISQGRQFETTVELVQSVIRRKIRLNSNGQADFSYV